MEFLAFALKCFSSSRKLECLEKPKQILKMEMFQEILFFDAINAQIFENNATKQVYTSTIGFIETFTEIIILHNFTLQMQEVCGVVLTVNALSRNCR